MIFATLVMSLIVPVVVATPPPTIDGVFTGYPPTNEWAGYLYPGADPTPKGTYIYFRQEGNWIYLMHDVITDTHNSWADTNYFPVYYKDPITGIVETFEVWIHAVQFGGYPIAHMQTGPIDHNEVTGAEVGALYQFAGAAGFGTSPHSGTSHRMYEFKINKTGFWKIHIEDIVIQSQQEEDNNWGGSVPGNPTGLARYANGTNLTDWTWFFKIDIGPVGGVWVPVDKFGLLAPYIGLASTIIAATAATGIYVKRVKRRKKKQ